MFDVLLTLLKNNQVKLIELYLKELGEKGIGLFTIIKDGNKADIRYYSPDKLPYPDIETEFKEKMKNVHQKNNKIEVKDKWIVTLPIVEIETEKDTEIPIWNLILDDGKNHVFFQGFPQEADLENGEKGLQYVLVAEPHNSTIAKNNWTVEATTVGQRYLEKCLESSRDFCRFLTFRSDSDYCKIVIPGKKEDGDAILNRVCENEDILQNLDNFRKNDKLGSPFTYNYGKYGYFSPNTLKYVNTYYELQNYFGTMENFNIIEFGGGYGGLCNILSHMVKWKNYTYVEIKEALELSKKCFLNIPLTNVKCMLPEDFVVEKQKGEYDLFISEFGFCELDEKGMDKFMFMLKNSKNAYLSMNLWDKNKKEKLKNKLLGIFKTVEEYPTFLKSEWGDYVWICKTV